ncbi:methyl-accepting chemotaxis protein [Anaerophaga thermohalophila]|uniref:methyl-accepting chemotaxis protein n=1 Tax=Anaerophaga thermohalophila TaxID=177400 RepID=UPI000237D1DE|nr:methyl-accepting chemotaxis protein [Anaerophaga thermohalophila]
MKWQSLKIKHKLFLGFGIVLMVTIIFGGILLTGLFAINKSSRALYHENIPALSKTYKLQNHWQQAIFNLRSFSSLKQEQFFVMANHHIEEAEKVLQSITSEVKSSGWQTIEDELALFKTQAEKSFKSALAVERSYEILDSAQQKLQKLSDNYLHLQYQKLKQDVDKGAAKYIIKRRADKIDLMNEIVNTAENLKIAVGETNFKNDPELLNNLSPSFDIIRRNVHTILPMTTKQYDIVALNEILEQNKICKSALDTLKSNWKIYNQLNNHDFLERGLSLTMDMAEKQEDYLISSARNNLQHATNARNTWWWSLSLSLIAGIILAWRISRSLSDPLLELTNLAELQGNGVLISIPDSDRKDEIGLLMRSMKSQQEQTKTMVKALTGLGNSLNDLMQRLKKRAENLMQYTASQASSTEEITASVEEIQALTENSSSQTQSATTKLKTAKAEVDQYINQNKEAIGLMQSIINRSNIISELASQTYILSLNASIEASRDNNASNRGFATIARSMRELAERVKAASDELNSISGKGRESSDEAIHNLDSIKEIISYNTEVLQNQVEMILQQSSEMSQISSAIQHLNSETQNTSQMAEMLNAEAERMHIHSEELSELLSFYKDEEQDTGKLPKVKQWEWAELLSREEDEESVQQEETIITQQ